MKYNLSVLITREDDIFIARCAELDVTSQGVTVDEAKANLKEAVELYLESFGADDIRAIKGKPVFTTIEVAA